jgi:hypothetical protein
MATKPYEFMRFTPGHDVAGRSEDKPETIEVWGRWFDHAGRYSTYGTWHLFIDVDVSPVGKVFIIGADAMTACKRFIRDAGSDQMTTDPSEVLDVPGDPWRSQGREKVCLTCVRKAKRAPG